MQIEIYTKATCPFCTRALELLDSKGVEYEHIEVGDDQEKRAALKEKADGRKTVPQIFINGEGIGGYDELAELDESGKLDEMLGK